MLLVGGSGVRTQRLEMSLLLDLWQWVGWYLRHTAQSVKTRKQCLEQAGGGAAPKRSALMTMVDVIERVREKSRDAGFEL